MSLFPEISLEKRIGLESRRYIGSKAKLTDWIFTLIKKEIENVDSFIDIFAGTAGVSKAAFPFFEKVIINDTLYSNNIIYKAFFESGDWNVSKIDYLIRTYNTFVAGDLQENYFSINFGGKFFEHNAAKKIGYIRQEIENEKYHLTEKEYNILLASLIYSMDKIANTVGHFDAYIKKQIKPQKLVLRCIQPCDFKGIEIFRENANVLARKIKADVAYIDPPYNSRQYSRFYHVYETLVKWNKPVLSGVALKPPLENMSVYCTIKAKDAFKDLIEYLDVKYFVVSYNNTYNSKSSSSENKIKLEEIEAILNRVGTTKIFESSHRFFNTGKTEFNNHKEILFITRVND